MVDTGIFATTAEVQAKVGANASTTYNAEAYINQYMTEAESYINAACRYNFSDNYSTLNVDKKGILKDAASCKAAMDVIQADPASCGTTIAQTKLNYLWARFNDCMGLLMKAETRGFINV